MTVFAERGRVVVASKSLSATHLSHSACMNRTWPLITCRLQSAFAAFLAEKQKMLANIREQREAAQRRKQALRPGDAAPGRAAPATPAGGIPAVPAGQQPAALQQRGRQVGRPQQLVSSRPQAPAGKGMFGPKAAARMSKRKLAAMVSVLSKCTSTLG